MSLNKCSCEGCELKSLFFEEVSPLDIELMCTHKITTTYLKGETIINEGDSIKEFVYLKNGLVKLVRNSGHDKEQIICFAGPLDFVSLLGVFSSNHYQYSVVALEDSTTCALDLQEIKHMAEENGKFALNIITKLNNVSNQIIIEMLELKQKRLFGRIAYILIFFSEKVYHSQAFELPVSRKEIAEFIGMTTENVIRTLSDLRKDGIIKIFGKTIEIIDIERLKKIKELS